MAFPTTLCVASTINLDMAASESAEQLLVKASQQSTT